MGPLYRPLPSLKGSEPWASVLEVVDHAVVMGSGLFTGILLFCSGLLLYCH